MIYPDNFEEKVGFDRIRSMLRELCLSPMGEAMVDTIVFSYDYMRLGSELAMTEEFQEILRYEDSFPEEHYYDISKWLDKIRVEGTFPEVRELYDLKRSQETVRRITAFFKKQDGDKYPVLSDLCGSVTVFPYVIKVIDRVIDNHGEVKDNASPELKEIRASLAGKSKQVSRRLDAILKQAKATGIVDEESSVSIRNGRGVIPVGAGNKRSIKGLIHDQSASGKTVYIEPEEIVELNNEIVELEYGEKREIIRILTVVADSIRPYIDDLLGTNRFLGEIDIIRAKALLGNQLHSVNPILKNKTVISWKRAVHPLLEATFRKSGNRKVVPLDIEVDEDNRILLISGPNAGGKSVCLKTVGLLQYMLQCGLTIPVEEGTEAGIFRKILIDIGDEQSIDNDLSTYSSHLINMKFFLKHGDRESLVLIDEFGTGTEPVLGGSIAEAILTELNDKKIFGVITTHYTNLKHMASVTHGIVNGAMAFDNHLMQPLFQLNIGKPGSSFAFEIARKIGLPDDILASASEKAGSDNIIYDKSLKDIARDKRYWDRKRQNIRKEEKRLQLLIAEYEKELTETLSQRKGIISRAKDEASQLLKESNRRIEKTIRQIREAQAEKEKTKEVREKLEKYREEAQKSTAPVEKIMEKRMKELKTRTVKVSKEERGKKKYSTAEEKKEARSLRAGDPVRMTDTMVTGEVVEIKGKTVYIETGSMKLSVPADSVERISRGELRKSSRSKTIPTDTDPEIYRKSISFSPEIDIRGVRGEEAVRRVQELVDNAVMVRHRNLRILHGKGNGVLRQLVREYLATVDIVISFRDEHVEAGGSGITVVEMDL